MLTKLKVRGDIRGEGITGQAMYIESNIETLRSTIVSVEKQ